MKNKCKRSTTPGVHLSTTLSTSKGHRRYLSLTPVLRHPIAAGRSTEGYDRCLASLASISFLSSVDRTGTKGIAFFVGSELNTPPGYQVLPQGFGYSYCYYGIFFVINQFVVTSCQGTRCHPPTPTTTTRSNGARRDGSSKIIAASRWSWCGSSRTNRAHPSSSRSSSPWSSVSSVYFSAV